MADKKVFRSVTPLFRIKLDPEDSCFRDTGAYREAKFTVTIRRYGHGQESFAELTKYAADSSRFQSLHLAENGFGNTEVFMIVEVEHQLSEELLVTSNSVESQLVGTALKRAVSLHAADSLMIRRTFHFSNPPGPHGPIDSTSSANVLPSLFIYSGTGVLPACEFDDMRATFKALLHRHWEDSSFGRVFDLALDYYLLSKCAGRKDHAFLILMVAFEALFKRNDMENLSNAATRFGRLVVNTKKELKEVLRRVTQGSYSYRVLRNQVAHGDPNVSPEEVKARLGELAVDIRVALRRLTHELGLQDESYLSGDYYDLLDTLATERFDGLPTK